MNIHTSIICPTFFGDRLEEIFDHIFNAKPLEPLFSTILNQRPTLLHALHCVKIVDFIWVSIEKKNINKTLSISPYAKQSASDISFSSCKDCLNAARANGTRHVPFREHPDIDTNTFPSFACVEHRWSGPNPMSCSAAMTKFVKSCATCRRHVPRVR